MSRLGILLHRQLWIWQCLSKPGIKFSIRGRVLLLGHTCHLNRLLGGMSDTARENPSYAPTRPAIKSLASGSFFLQQGIGKQE